MVIVFIIGRYGKSAKTVKRRVCKKKEQRTQNRKKVKSEVEAFVDTLARGYVPGEGWMLYDSWRFNDKTTFREQLFVVSPCSDFDISDTILDVGVEATAFALGWHFANFDLSVGDFLYGKTGVSFNNNGKIGAGYKVCLYHPNISFNIRESKVTLSGEIGSLGVGCYNSKDEFSFNYAQNGLGIGIAWTK